MVKLSPYWKTVIASMATVQSVAEDGALDIGDSPRSAWRS